MALPSTSIGDHTNSTYIAADVFAEYGDFIRSVIIYNVRDKSKADDLFQDFFLSLVHKPPPATVQNIKHYLYRAITNDIVDAARREKNYQSHKKKYARGVNYSVNKKTPQDAFIDVEETNKFFALIEKRLLPSEAQAVTLRYRDNRSIKEIAKEMGVKVRSVSRYISMGKGRIHQFFTGKTR